MLEQFPYLRKLAISLRHRYWSNATVKALKSYLSETKPAKLQLGAGGNAVKGWFNTDYFPGTEGVYFLDVTKRFPIDSSSFDFAFTEHHIEHIHYKEAVFMLTEVYRVLKPGGTLRVITPDLRSSLLSYINADKQAPSSYLYSGFAYARNYIPVDEYFLAHDINDMFMNYEHKFIYDLESMKRILVRAGFINIKEAKSSTLPAFQNIESHTSADDVKYSLYMEAQKPA